MNTHLVFMLGLSNMSITAMHPSLATLHLQVKPRCIVLVFV